MRIAIDRMFELGRPIDGLDAMAALAIEQVSRSPSEGTRTLDEAIRIGERFGLDAPVWALRALRCEFLVTEGRFDALVEESGSVLRWATKSNDAISRLSALRALSVVEGLRGDELIDLDELVELARAFGESGAIVLVDAAAIAASRGDQARARDLLEEASGVVTDAPPSLARKAIELGYPELVGSIEFHQGRNPTEIASASVVDAMLAERRGDLLGAIEGYRGALETFEALGRPIEVARSHQLLGHALLTGGTKRGGSSACARFAGTLGRDGCYTSGTGGRCASRERAAGGDARRCTLLAEASRNVVGSGSLLPRWIG
jgi:hypothetical protein